MGYGRAVPVPTPFHPRTSALCTSLLWKEWAGTHAVRSYDTCHEPEYMAIRQAAGLIDVSALYKVEVCGPDAGALLARVMVNDPRRLAEGRVTYLCWCDDDGKVLDDGTVTRLGADRFRVTAAEPAYGWLRRCAGGYRVELLEQSETLAALALQGPTSRDILVAAGAGVAGELGYFRHAVGAIGGARVELTRTGYTGDLGFEIWVAASDAVAVYDTLMAAGRPYRIEPAGLDAMDVTRIEAGFVMSGVDYQPANHCFLESRKSSPFEIGLGWAVALERETFIGQAALRRNKERGPASRIVGLVYDWDQFEALHAARGLPPQVAATAWRDPRPVYEPDSGRQVGYATSGTWSPTLKKLLALATVESRFAAIGSELRIETTVEFERCQVGCRVAKTPFFNPARRRA
jgi:aminomethyltransferase